MTNLSNLKKQFEALEKFCDGQLGVSAHHIEKNHDIHFNHDQRFLMCSTYKVAIAIYLLHKTEKNEIDLNELCKISEADFLPGIISTLNQLNFDVPQHISLHSLLRFMLQESCNSSTGIILNKIGGPPALNNFLQQINIHEIAMDFYTFDMFASWDGIKKLPDHCTLAQYKELEQAVPVEEVIATRKKIVAEIEKSGEGTATPQAMTMLLTKLFKNELLSKKSTELLLQIMRGCKRGPLRLMGLLPPRTPVAHKTGTLTGYTCDIGIITLPHNAGNIAISAYIKNSSKELANNERVLAEIGRSLYDYFLFT
jgi:beta-lactamase class A